MTETTLLGLDLGGTKLSWCLFDQQGNVLKKDKVRLDDRTGSEVGALITGVISVLLQEGSSTISSIGVCIPGIFRSSTGTVWAPNIPGWEDYPLLSEIKNSCGSIPVQIDNDRACSLMGEQWKGKARDVHDALFLAVGTGIGLGILANGNIIRGSQDIAGAIGWSTFDREYDPQYKPCGFFEYHASGAGLAKVAVGLMAQQPLYDGVLRNTPSSLLAAEDIFKAFELEDPLAEEVIRDFIRLWGMATANLISLFNPECLIFGGGVFGPASRFIPEIQQEASKWAQPLSFQKALFHASQLGGEAGVTGAGYLALKSLPKTYL